MSTWQSVLALMTAGTCIFLMLVILIQRGRGSGLAGAFGGAGGSSAFGAKTGDVLTWATVIIAFFFLTLTVVANFGFDESPKPVIALEVEDLPEFPETLFDDTGSVTQITIPPLDLPNDNTEPAPTTTDEAVTPVAPPIDDANAGGDD